MATLKKVGKVWYSDLRVNGKRVQRALSSNERIAQGMLDDMVLARRAEKRGEVPRDVSIDFFRERHKTISKNPQTKYRDELAFRMLKESMPAVTKLAQITPELLIRLKHKWEHCGHCDPCKKGHDCKKPPKSLSTVTRAIKAIKAAMRVAETWRYTEVQPWHGVKLTEPKGRLLFYSEHELNTLLRFCHGSWHTFAMLCARAGLRPGEAYNLEWSDIDFARGTIWVHNKEGWSPKKRKERRVPLEDDLRAYLTSLPQRKGYVVGPERMTLKTLDVYFRRLVRNAHLKGSAYTLRHTFASHLVMHGATLPEIKEMMGHSSIKMTEIYAHLAPQVVQSAIKKMPRLASGLHPGSTEGDILSVI